MIPGATGKCQAKVAKQKVTRMSLSSKAWAEKSKIEILEKLWNWMKDKKIEIILRAIQSLVMLFKEKLLKLSRNHSKK